LVGSSRWTEKRRGLEVKSGLRGGGVVECVNNGNEMKKEGLGQRLEVQKKRGRGDLVVGRSEGRCFVLWCFVPFFL